MHSLRKLLLLIALCSSTVAFGQLTADPEDRREQGKDPLRTQTPEGRPLPFSQRLRFGGGINNIRFGNPFSFGVSPVIAYQTTERLLLGVGATYSYAKYTYAFGPVTYNQYGGRAFAMYEFIPAILPNLYLHGEIENSTVVEKVEQNGQSSSGSVGLTAPLIGLTYSQPISGRFGINLTALYNLNYNQNQGASQFVYGSPLVIRLSFF